jgi:threonine aldolase
MSAERCAEISERAHAIGLPVHVDGARIFNAAVAQDTTVAELTKYCDSVQFCLSKGLGAPVGSVLVGSHEFIKEARIWRKRLGGGMRQAGILAAAGLIALEESPKRLHEDHTNAKTLAIGLAAIPGIALDVETVETNIVIFDVSGTGKTSSDICGALQENGILASGFGSRIRMVTHLDATAEDVEKTIVTLDRILRRELTAVS